jgi:hypothetical protein
LKKNSQFTLEVLPKHFTRIRAFKLFFLNCAPNPTTKAYYSNQTMYVCANKQKGENQMYNQIDEKEKSKFSELIQKAFILFFYYFLQNYTKIVFLAV